MKRDYIYSLILILFVGLCSCNKSAQQTKSESGNPLIKLMQCYQQVERSETFNLCFDSVLEDSRCPKNAVCIWQGVARVKFTLSSKNYSHSFTLASLKMPPLYAKDTILQGYKFEFINLYPYPGDGASEVKAEVKITKQ